MAHVDIGDRTQYLWTRRQTPGLISCPQDTIHTLKLNLLSGPSHLRCESVGLNLMRPGTDSTDSECGEHGPHRGPERRHVAGIIPGVMLVMAVMIIAIILCKKKIGKCYIKLTCIRVMLNDSDCCPDMLMYCLSLYRIDW